MSLSTDLQILYKKYGFDRIITRMKIDIEEKYPDRYNEEEISNIYYSLERKVI